MQVVDTGNRSQHRQATGSYVIGWSLCAYLCFCMCELDPAVSLLWLASSLASPRFASTFMWKMQRAQMIYDIMMSIL